MPPVLFLDEPTTGLDPRSRIELWSVIRELVADGTTLLLTTQYLEEADQLADDIVVIDRGRAIAEGTADDLKAQVGGERIELTVRRPEDLGRAHELLATHTPANSLADVDVRPAARTLLAPVADGVADLAAVLDELRRADIDVSDIGVRRPTLDDVFLTLTGHVAEHDPDASAGSADEEDAPSSTTAASAPTTTTPTTPTTPPTDDAHDTEVPA